VTRATVIAMVIVMGFFPIGGRSDVSGADREEVLHLLEFLRSSGCAMERNGKRYDSEDAYSHVKRKYKYFRDKIETSEDFIEYCASKSTMSGRDYLVLCENAAAVRTRDWFLAELFRYRGSGDPECPPGRLDQAGHCDN
jgi:Family of unknown function (DUF5329)